MREIILLHCLFFVVQIICDDEVYEPIYFKEEEVRHIRDTGTTVPKPACKENTLISYLAEFQVTNPESIIGISIADFESACRTVEHNVRKIDNYLRNCTSSPSLYMNLIYGVRALDEKLCKNADFYKKYEKYYTCFHDLDNDYDVCDGADDWNENEDKEKICKSYKSIVNCYYIKTAKVCGLNAAKTLKEIMVETIDCVLTVRCSVSSNPTVKDAMPEKYMEQLVRNKGCSTVEEYYCLQFISFVITALLYLILD